MSSSWTTRSKVSRALRLASLNPHSSLLLLDPSERGIRSRSLTPRSSSLWSTLSVTSILFPLAPCLLASRLGITVARLDLKSDAKLLILNSFLITSLGSCLFSLCFAVLGI
ncbi:hypothetical protein SLEP1_g14918 [Rubroshorea leprosula]|uniref:Uncharacterized protein n=1 Tax=Rubroshorea leprosula TaxID=152421 RepID=A0AAV5IWF8_9ROSI|nr:hypothetical protein SLEP1_g14918 [Rubroshorea leprosula]